MVQRALPALVALFALSGALLASPCAAEATLADRMSSSAPFNSSVVLALRGFLLKNVNYGGNGAVLASPDANVFQGGSYRYAWQRDGALVMNVVLQTMDADEADPLLEQWLDWVERTTADADPNGIATIVEPKFNLDGSVFNGGWCRPQNDGPGLRAKTLSLWALRRGLAAVPKGLYAAVKKDLDWVAANYESQGCDAWEEVTSNNFFWDRFVQRRGLLAGAELADAAGDSASASSWRAAASAIEGGLASFDNGQFVQEADIRKKDAIVMCAFNDGYAGDSVYAPTDASVARTIGVYDDLFNSAFPINGADTRAGVPGVLYGRYEGDHYGGGNPWILTTSCLARVFYRGASHVARAGQMPRDEDVAAWSAYFGRDLGSPAELAAALASAGDGVLERVRYHVAGASYHMSEQLDKDSGYEISATDLSWSYGSTLLAIQAREDAMADIGVLQK